MRRRAAGLARLPGFESTYLQRATSNPTRARQGRTPVCVMIGVSNKILRARWRRASPQWQAAIGGEMEIPGANGRLGLISRYAVRALVHAPSVGPAFGH